MNTIDRFEGYNNIGEEFVPLRTEAGRVNAERVEHVFFNKSTGSHDLLAQTTKENRKQRQKPYKKGFQNTQEPYNNIGNQQKGGQSVRSGEYVCKSIGGVLSSKLERRKNRRLSY